MVIIKCRNDENFLADFVQAIGDSKSLHCGFAVDESAYQVLVPIRYADGEIVYSSIDVIHDASFKDEADGDYLEVVLYDRDTFENRARANMPYNYGEQVAWLFLPARQITKLIAFTSQLD